MGCRNGARSAEIVAPGQRLYFRQLIDSRNPKIGNRLAQAAGMNSHEVLAYLTGAAAVCVSVGRGISQYRDWKRSRRWRRITARLLEW